jgi:hypothetical protein
VNSPSVNWRQYLAAAATAGAAWSLLAFALDYGVQDMQSMSCIPPGVIGFVGALFCGAFTGIAVAVVFRWLFRRTPKFLFPLLPVLTLPVAIATFSLLVWLERRALGTPTRFAPREELLEVLAIYGIYGLISIFMLFLYVVALGTQWWFRLLLRPRMA